MIARWAYQEAGKESSLCCVRVLFRRQFDIILTSFVQLAPKSLALCHDVSLIHISKMLELERWQATFSDYCLNYKLHPRLQSCIHLSFQINVFYSKCHLQWRKGNLHLYCSWWTAQKAVAISLTMVLRWPVPRLGLQLVWYKLTCSDRLTKTLQSVTWVDFYCQNVTMTTLWQVLDEP